MTVSCATVRPKRHGRPPSMCVDEEISILRIVRQNAASTSHTVMPLPTGFARCDVPTPPTF